MTTRKSIQMTEASAAHVEPALLSVADFGRRIGLSRNAVYGLIARGEISSVKLLDRRLIPVTEIVRLMNNATRKELVADEA